MEEFTIKGDNGFIKIALNNVHGFPNETCHWGGYDSEASIEIKSGNFQVSSKMYISTGEIFEFYTQLLQANKSLAGDIYLRNYENNLDANLKYDVNGHVSIKASFWDFDEFDNHLKFEIRSDQSYISLVLEQLKVIVEKYGGLKGVK